MATVTYTKKDGGRYPSPSDEKINKVFPSDEFRFQFTNEYGVWTNYDIGFYMTEEELDKYIKLGYKDDDALAYYEQQCETLYRTHKAQADKLFGSKQ